MNTLKQQILTGERSLFKACNRQIRDSIFDHGESPLKESSNIKVTDSIFKWKYPFWYSNKVHIQNSYLEDGARAGLWYSKAGLQTASVLIPNPVLRHKVNRGLNTDEIAEPNSFAIEATIAAFTQGESWLTELNHYIQKIKI